MLLKSSGQNNFIEHIQCSKLKKMNKLVKINLMFCLGMTLASSIAYACCRMTGKITACEANRNFLVFCGGSVSDGEGGNTGVFNTCTGQSDGTQYPNSSSVDENGNHNNNGNGYRILPATGTCASLAYATGECCGGAVTEWWIVGAYFYGKCNSTPCPQP